MDITCWLRPEAHTSPARILCHTCGGGKDQHVMIPGWPHSIGRGRPDEALTIMCQALRHNGARTIAMEDPSAPRYRAIAADAGLTPLSVPCDENGLCAAELDRVPADAVLVTPAHQYPLGVTLSAQRRSALIDWARRSDTVIIEDDYDGEFRFDRRPVGALRQLDPDHVVYAGTASKTLAPGLRLGWLTMPPMLRPSIIEVRDRLDRGNGVLDQLVLAELITSGEFDRHVRRMRTTYRLRRDRLLSLLANEMPGLDVGGIAAGMHVVLSLPHPVQEARVLAEAAKHALLIHGLADYWHGAGEQHPPAIIVGYGTPAAHAFGPALDTLTAVLAAARR